MYPFDPTLGGLRWFPGTWIRVLRSSGVWHHGIISGGSGGYVWVIHNSKGLGVACTTVEAFACSASVEIVKTPGSMDAGLAIIRRAMSRIGTSYDLFSANCEHFASWAFNGKAESSQLQQGVFLGLATLGLVALLRSGT